VVAPEHAADLGQLVKLLEVAGLSVATSPAEDPGEGTAVVSASGVSAADLNRLAARGGITLRQISERTHSLEDVFFALTGTDAGMRPGQEMGAIK
jgi:hypothetical protein